MIQTNLGFACATRRITHAAGAALLGVLAPLLGCSDDGVNMGQNSLEPPPPPLPSSSRCLESTAIEGDVIVRNQEDLVALEGCQVIEGSLHVVAFEGADLGPLYALTAVRDTLDIGGGWVLVDDPETAVPDRSEYWLASLHGLESLESVGTLSITGHMGQDVDALANLRHVTSGVLMIELNRALADLGGLRNATVLRSLYISGCPALEGIEPLELPERMTDLVLDFSGIRRLELGVRDITGQLHLDHTELRDLDGLSSLESVGELHVVANFSLEDVGGLNGLRRADSMLFELNPRLTRLPEFSSLTWLESLHVAFHDGLTALPEFPMLNVHTRGFEVEYFAERPEELIVMRPDLFEIFGNAKLSAFTMPAAWLSGGAVIIENNAALARIDFTEQKSLEYLSIQNNAALDSVGLGALDTVSRLDVIGNPGLQLSVFDPVRTFQTIASGNAPEL